MQAGLKIVAFFMLLSTAAALEIGSLPETLAVCDGVPVKREDVAGELARPLSALNLPDDRDRIRKAVRRAVDNEICRRMLGSMLTAAGFSPSRELTVRYVNESLRPLAPAAKLAFEKELLPQVDKPEFQLKAATHLFLLTRFDPALFEVSAAEVERCYQLNQANYRRADRWDVGVIRIDRKRKDAADAAGAARARLLQGESFDRIAAEYSPDGGEGQLVLEKVYKLFAAELSRLSAGDVSAVLRDTEAFYVLLLRDKKIGGVIPLAEAEPYIRMELSALKDSLALRKLLAERFVSANIVYTPLDLSDAK